MIRVYAGLALAAILAAGFWWAHHSGYSSGQANVQAKYDKHLAEDAVASLAAVSNARAVEHTKAEQQAAIAESYEKGKTDAQTKEAGVVADLRDGNLRLRAQWRGCQTARVPGIAARPGERDAAGDGRDEAAGAVVRVGAEADAQLAACQAIVKADRQ